MALSSFKRRWIENWCEDVYLHLKDGSMCSNVIGYPSEETGGVNLQGLLKSALPLNTESLKHVISNAVKTSEKEPHQEALPMVKLAYSHLQEQRHKVERLVNGLPVLSNSTTQIERESKLDDKHVPFFVMDSSETVKLKRDGPEVMSRGKLTSAPATLAAQRLAQELRKQHQDSVRVDILNANNQQDSRFKTAFSKPNVTRARRLLAKRNQAPRRFDDQPYSPIENCWTMAEMTYT